VTCTSQRTLDDRGQSWRQVRTYTCYTTYMYIYESETDDDDDDYYTIIYY